MRQTIRIPKDSRVLVVEDDPTRLIWFQNRLKWVTQDTYCNTPESALNALKMGAPFDIVFLDHDAGIEDKEGKLDTFILAAIRLRELEFEAPVIVHSMNPVGVKRITQVLRDIAVPAVFGTFELEIV